MPERKVLSGLKEIAEHLGLKNSDARRLIRSWVAREGLPVKKLAGRWYADVVALDVWWSSKMKHNKVA